LGGLCLVRVGEIDCDAFVGNDGYEVASWDGPFVSLGAGKQKWSRSSVEE